MNADVNPYQAPRTAADAEGRRPARSEFSRVLVVVVWGMAGAVFGFLAGFVGGWCLALFLSQPTAEEIAAGDQADATLVLLATSIVVGLLGGFLGLVLGTWISFRRTAD